MTSRRIAVAVHGRFYAFDLVRELIGHGISTTLLTNYPKWAVARFGVPPSAVESNVWHGIVSRVTQKFDRPSRARPFCETYLHESFGRWAAERIAEGDFDVAHCFSGVAEETFNHPACRGKLKVLVRASSHIATQRRLLEEEETRSGTPIEKPSEWMVERECREYRIADRIVVLSAFAYRSFVLQGIPESRLWMLPLAVESSRFRTDARTAKARADRITSGARLRVLTTGAFSLRKGALDYADIVEGSRGAFEFRWIGPVPPEGEALKSRLGDAVTFIPKVPQFDLKQHYEWADLYLFPTIEDGFPVVLSQAQAAGLPLLATPHCSAPDIVRENETGWIVPARAPGQFLERLVWCDTHRGELAAVTQASYDAHETRDWAAVAARFGELVQDEAR